MVQVDYETPMKLALSVAKDATPDSSGKEILKRYRELVARKSAERIKTQSLSFNNDDDDESSLLSAQSSAVNSLGTIMSMEKDIDINENDEEGGYLRDDVTDAIVQEATMIKNHMRDTIREKRMLTKTPGKSKTPSRFRVFQDRGEKGEDKFNNTSMSEYNNGDDDRDTTLKSQKKRSALQPKSANANYPHSSDQMKKGMDSSMLKKPQRNATGSGSNVTKPNATTIQEKSKIIAMSSPIPQSSLEINSDQSTYTEQNQNQEQLSEKFESLSKSDTNTSRERFQQKQNELDLKREAFLEAIKEKTSPIRVPNIETNKSTERETIDEEEATMKSNRTSHEGVEEEEGELLSIGSAVSTSMISEEESSQNNALHNKLQSNNNDASQMNEVTTPTGGHTYELDDDHTTTSSLQTPANSVQTFSIGGRSYSLDMSSNVFKSMFSSPPGRTFPILNTEKNAENRSGRNNDSEEESETSESIYQDISVKSGDYLSNVVSPSSKAFAIGINESMEGGISKESAASLIERNKTLVKEVRFADQTCVELSERNAGMQRDVNRLEGQISEMKQKNDSFQEVFLKSKEECAKLETRNDGLTRQLTEQRNQFENQMSLLEKALKEQKDLNQRLTIQVEEGKEQKVSMEKTLVLTQAKFEALQENNIETNGKVSSLMERLVASQSSAEVSAASAAQSYRSFCNESEKNVEKLEKLANDRLDMYNNEKNERIQLEKEKNDLVEKYCNNDSDNNCSVILQEKTPSKMLPDVQHQFENTQMKTPTSAVLARTLEAELQRGHDAIERILEAEMIITITQSELKETTKQLGLATSEIRRLNNQVMTLSKDQNEVSIKSLQDEEPSVGSEAFENSSHESSSSNSCSTDELVEKVLDQKLTYAKFECEGYKRDLENILKEINGLQDESFHTTGSQDGSNDQTITGLLQAVRELAQVGSRQANDISRLKFHDDEKKRKIDQLKLVLQEKEEKTSQQQSHIEELQNKIESISHHCSRQADEIKTTLSQMNEISQDNQEKNAELANKEARCDELLDKIRELSQLCNRQSQDLKLMQSEIEKINRALSKKESQLFAKNYREECFLNEVEDFAARITTMKDNYEPPRKG